MLIRNNIWRVGACLCRGWRAEISTVSKGSKDANAQVLSLSPLVQQISFCLIPINYTVLPHDIPLLQHNQRKSQLQLQYLKIIMLSGGEFDSNVIVNAWFLHEKRGLQIVSYGINNNEYFQLYPKDILTRLFSVWLFVTQSCPTLCEPMDWAHQTPLSMGFSRQEYSSGLSFPSPGDLPDPGIKPASPALQADSLSSESPGKPLSSLNQGTIQQSIIMIPNIRLNQQSSSWVSLVIQW